MHAMSKLPQLNNAVDLIRSARLNNITFWRLAAVREVIRIRAPMRA